MRLLLVEDNSRLSNLIATGLVKEGFAIDVAHSIRKATEAINSIRFAAIILDLGLPDGDGLSVVRHMRHRGDPTPILIITARLSVQDRVKGLGQGADDYLGKPFAFDELVARIRALLRRPPTYLSRELVFGRLSFDTEGHEISIGGAPQQIAPREAAILEALMRRHNHVVPKKLLEGQLYGLEGDGSPNAVEVYVHRLRKRLADADAGVEIHTVRGVGYLLKVHAD